MRICLDPGHGGTDPGAIGPTGRQEADVVLQVATAAERLLAADGHIVTLTRHTDLFVSLPDRAKASKRTGAELFVSIHCNAAVNPAASGHETWTRNGEPASLRLAMACNLAMGAQWPQSRNRGLKSGRLAVLAQRIPCCLVELGFISHPATESAMRTPAWIEQAARAVYNGITGYIKGAP